MSKESTPKEQRKVKRGQHPKSLANLRRGWQPGESGNPKGRREGVRNVSTVLREMLENLAPAIVINEEFIKDFCKGLKRVTVGDATAARILNEALVKGEAWAIKELLDRTEGKPTQPVDQETRGTLEVIVKREQRTDTTG